jgi:hypothetical protein
LVLVEEGFYCAFLIVEKSLDKSLFGVIHTNKSTGSNCATKKDETNKPQIDIYARTRARQRHNNRSQINGSHNTLILTIAKTFVKVQPKPLVRARFGANKGWA